MGGFTHLRRQAAQAGQKTFNTGAPCKHGHMVPRYTSTGACTACLKQTYAPRRNAWTLKLVAFYNDHLWTSPDLTKGERLGLRVYLQECIFAYLRNIPRLKSVDLETAMFEIEERGKNMNPEDPRNTD